MINILLLIIKEILHSIYFLQFLLILINDCSDILFYHINYIRKFYYELSKCRDFSIYTMTDEFYFMGK